MDFEFVFIILDCPSLHPCLGGLGGLILLLIYPPPCFLIFILLKIRIKKGRGKRGVKIRKQGLDPALARVVDIDPKGGACLGSAYF
jgi:hypothetical protein